MTHYAGRDWAVIAEILAEDCSTMDHRPVVNAGLRHGRDAVIAEVRAIAEVGLVLTSGVIATRGERLVLSRGLASEAIEQPDAFRSDLLDVVEIDTNEQVVARVTFDVDDIDAALAELDARYLAGRGRRLRAYVVARRRRLCRVQPTRSRCDDAGLGEHRSPSGAGFAPGDMIPYMQAAWDDSPDTRIYIAAVHRISAIGAVVTHVAQGISQDGFDAEWRDITILTVDGNLVDRCELFDHDDLAAALARFDELS